jgi:hypothetical protein
MDFTDLYKKIYSLDTLSESSEITECGCMDNAVPTKQQDSLNMNVSITGQGANGIRDLMDILRNIDKKDEPDSSNIQTSSPEPLRISSDDMDSHDEPEIITISSDDYTDESEMEPQYGDPDKMVLGSDDQSLEDEYEDDNFANSMKNGSAKRTLGVSAVLAMGNDLLSKGEEAPKVNGGGNPLAETLVSNLYKLYNEVKSR